MTSRLIGCARPLVEVYDSALVDLDGVTYLGHEPIPWASESLVAARDRGMQVVFVTNNASRSPQVVADQLTSLGIPSGPDDVMTASQSAASLLATRLQPGAKVLVVGTDALRNAVREKGFVVVGSADDEPAAVASRIVETVRAGKRDAYFGFPESFFVRLNALAPSLVDGALAANDRKAATLFATAS